MRAKHWLQRGIKHAATIADRVRPPDDGIVVLIYHRVGGGSTSEVDLPAEVFEAQMRWLADRERAISLEAAIDAIDGRLTMPATADGGAPVVITFDDGTEDFARVATPILARHRIPATLYLATEFVDEQRSFPGDAAPLSWAALQETTSSGVVTIGSHTHRHQLLDRLPEAEIADELDRSIDLIGEHVGQAPLDFAYPKAVLGSTAARRAVAARFRSAAVAGTHANPPGADVHQLARSPIQRSDGMAHFHQKVAGGMALEDDLRRLLNRRRYASATT